jgi:type IV secretory pathway VirD2 relaxase
MSEEEREFRLRPGKPPVSKASGGVMWSSGFRLLMNYARQSKGGGGSSGGTRSFPHRQRCAVRITYTKNTTRGQWRAHGRYLERESAAGNGAGFNAHETGIEISNQLQRWQASRDKMVWKFIVSPEFGDRADLERLTRDLMGRIENDLGGPLEWVAVVHRNTEHRHAHVALRGVTADGKPLRLERDYLKRGVREIAEEMCTRQMGFRTSLDAAEGERREVEETRFTSLDRTILRNARADERGFVLTQPKLKQHISARLVVLSRMGMAKRDEQGTWVLKSDMEQVLRAMQRARDRQKTLFAQGALVSDQRLPIEVMDWQQMKTVEGRVLMHGEDEQSGKRFMMLESTSAKVLFIEYTPEMDSIRGRGGLKANSFLRLRSVSENGRIRAEVEDFGHAEAILTNRTMLREKIHALRETGLGPAEEGWGGWLGRYQRALCEIEAERSSTGKSQQIDRKKHQRDRGLER